MYAIIAAGGKQFRVSKDDVIYIEKVNLDEGAEISFDVLMVGDDGSVKVGDPLVAGASVKGKVAAQVKGRKIKIGKYKSKKNYDRVTGHRQPYTKVEITEVIG